MDRSKCFGLLVLDHTQCRPNLHQLETFNEVWNDMALTTLPFGLLGIDNWYASQSTTLRIIVLGLAILAVTTLTSCGSGGDESASNTDSPGSSSRGGVPAGSGFASLAWDPVPNVHGYLIHYGPSSPGSPGSCAYAQSTFTSDPSVTVTGLANNTTYYFAASAYNGLESACSSEVSMVTGSA